MGDRLVLLTRVGQVAACRHGNIDERCGGVGVEGRHRLGNAVADGSVRGFIRADGGAYVSPRFHSRARTCLPRGEVASLCGISGVCAWNAAPVLAFLHMHLAVDVD